jgi:hypothetical protein
VTLTDETGKQQNLLVWYATDLKDFPVKLQAQDKGGELTLLYRNLKLEPPTAAAFNPPAEFTKHASVEAMMQQVMMKMMGGGGPPR